MAKVLIYYLMVINIVTFLVYGIDKIKAKQGSWRISEATLLIFAVIGGIIGAAVLYAITSAAGLIGTGANDLQALDGAGTKVTVFGGFLAEMFFTFVFVLVVLGATAKTNGATNNFAGLAIGLSLVLVHLACIRYTGTSVNPARSIGPALFQGGTALTNLWIFIVAPMVGGALSAGVWKVIDPSKKK